MKKILILGAGRSSSSLIKYLLDQAVVSGWFITVGDFSFKLANEKVKGKSNARAIAFDVNNEEQRREEIQKADLVISLLPPPFHFSVAQTCIEYSRHLLTASYASPEINGLHEQAVKSNILILMESGLDPGIDHMSAMKEIDEIKSKGGKLTSFKSFAGGLVAPESDNNPWHYKFTWNPRNVVLAGQGTSKYLEGGKLKELSYHELFSHTEKISVKGYGDFEAYANRDSLKYLSTYQLEGLSTFLRGTLRRPGYCSTWNIFVQLGLTDDYHKIQDSENITYKQLLNSLIKDDRDIPLYEKLKKYGADEDIKKVEWTGIFEDKKTGLPNASPAEILQHLLEKKWKLEKGDKDMIVMQHQFDYELDKKKKRLTSSLVVKGDDELYTAMAKTVGLPLGIAARLLLAGKINIKGVKIPVSKEIYEPVLKELEGMGIKFINEEVDL